MGPFELGHVFANEQAPCCGELYRGDGERLSFGTRGGATHPLIAVPAGPTEDRMASYEIRASAGRVNESSDNPDHCRLWLRTEGEREYLQFFSATVEWVELVTLPGEPDDSFWAAVADLAAGQIEDRMMTERPTPLDNRSDAIQVSVPGRAAWDLALEARDRLPRLVEEERVVVRTFSVD